MPRLPPTPHSMDANEPKLGRWVHDDASGLEGLVIEVKVGGWRVVQSEGGHTVNRRSGALEYAEGEPSATLVEDIKREWDLDYFQYTREKDVLSRRRQKEIYEPRRSHTPVSRHVKQQPPRGRARPQSSPFPSQLSVAALASRPGPGAPRAGDGVARLCETGWRRGVVLSRQADGGDWRLSVRYGDSQESEERWPSAGDLFKVGGRLPEALVPPPRGLVGHGFRFDDGRIGFIVGCASRDSKFLVRTGPDTTRVPVHAARAYLARDQESNFGRVNRKAIAEFNTNRPLVCRPPSPDKRRRTPQVYDDPATPSQPPSETKRTPKRKSLSPGAAGPIRERAFSGHALLQGFMQG